MTSNVWSWGWEREGCLGLPENTEADDSEYVRIPRPVLLENVVQIASGNSHVLALTNSGDIYSWGRTASGRLGYVTGKEKQPLPLEVYSGLKFSQVACGSHHNLALTVQGQIASWGSGFSGQCGQNNKLDIEKPTIISSTGTTKFIKVSAGYYHSMALDEEKNVWIWGTGKDGQLGLGSQTTALTPVLLKFDKRLKFTQIVASEFNSFAMTTSGQVFMWGGNRYGIIGNGLYGPSIVAWTPSLLALPNGLTFKSIAMSAYFAVAVSTQGKLYTWGRGLGTIHAPLLTALNVVIDLSIVTEPTLMATPGIDNTSFVSVDTKAQHILFLTDTGDVYVMGSGEYGQLGLDGQISAPTIQKLSNLSGATQIAAGNFHSLALTSMAPELSNFVVRNPNRNSPLRSDDTKQFLTQKKKSLSSGRPHTPNKNRADLKPSNEEQLNEGDHSP